MKRHFHLVIWLIVCLVIGKLLVYYFQPIELGYTLILFLLPIILFGFQNHTYHEYCDWKIFKKSIFSSDKLISRTVFWGMPISKKIVVFKEREILSEVELEKVIDFIVPILLKNIPPFKNKIPSLPKRIGHRDK